MTVVAPLDHITHKDVTWRWTVECESAFTRWKKMVADAGVLVHYDVNLPIKLQCDTSPYAVEAVLSHVMDSGEDRPIAFASTTPTSSE